MKIIVHDHDQELSNCLNKKSPIKITFPLSGATISVPVVAAISNARCGDLGDSLIYRFLPYLLEITPSTGIIKLKFDLNSVEYFSNAFLLIETL